MKHDLSNKRVAILAADGFEDSELFDPQTALQEAGAITVIVSLEEGEIEGKNGRRVGVDLVVEKAKERDFHALLLPGGVVNPDLLRRSAAAVAFARSFFDVGKPVAAICHGPQLLIEADVVRGRRMTSFPSIKTDLVNAGAEWVDESVVVDSGFVTSRKPSDIPDFNDKMLEEIGEGVHAQQHS